MSALAHFADPKSDISRGPRSATTGREHLQQGEGKELLDHLVGAGKQRRWRSEAERLGGLEP